MYHLKYIIFSLLSFWFLYAPAVAQEQTNTNVIDVSFTNKCETVDDKTKAIISIMPNSNNPECGLIDSFQSGIPIVKREGKIEVPSNQTALFKMLKTNKSNQPCNYVLSVENTNIVYSDAFDSSKPVYCKMDNNGQFNSCRCSN